MFVKPTYVFRLEEVGHYIASFIEHPYEEMRRVYACSIAQNIHDMMLNRMEMLQSQRWVWQQVGMNDAEFTIDALLHLQGQTQAYIRWQHVPLCSLLHMCRNYHCLWYYRSISKLPDLHAQLEKAHHIRCAKQKIKLLTTR